MYPHRSLKICEILLFLKNSGKILVHKNDHDSCMARFRRFGQRMFVSRVVFIGPQILKTKAANDSDGLLYGLLVTAGQCSLLNVLESLSLRIGYSKRMLVAGTDWQYSIRSSLGLYWDFSAGRQGP